jgi:hypothetical protein
MRSAAVLLLLLAAQARADVSVEVIADTETKAVILRYEGETLEKALAGGNRLKGDALHRLLRIDAKDPLAGTLPWGRGFRYREAAGGDSIKVDRGGQNFDPIELRFARKDRDSKEWQLTKESLEAVRKQLPEAALRPQKNRPRR